MLDKEKKNKRNREFMRRWVASLTPEQKTEYLAKRRASEIPRQREKRKADPEKHRIQQRVLYARDSRKFKDRATKYRGKVKAEVLSRYGGVCRCCGEDESVFLSIDHINGDGAQHRKQGLKASGLSFYQWLRKNGYPEGFQVLCYNCNFAKRTGDECPHRKIVMDRIFSLVKRGG